MVKKIKIFLLLSIFTFSCSGSASVDDFLAVVYRVGVRLFSQSVDDFSKPLSLKWFTENLTKGERQIIYRYTLESARGIKKPFHKVLNSSLVKGIDCAQIEGCRQLLLALTKIPKFRGLLYKEVRDNHPDFSDFFSLKLDGIYQNKGFMSTSRVESRGVMENGLSETQFIFVKGFSGRSIEALSKDRMEKEVLFPPGAQFKVVEVIDEVIHIPGLSKKKGRILVLEEF